MTKIQAALEINRTNGHCGSISCTECCLDIRSCTGDYDDGVSVSIEVVFGNIEAVRLSQAREYLSQCTEVELFEAAL